MRRFREQQSPSLTRYTLPTFTTDVQKFLTSKEDNAPTSPMLNMIVNQI
jgi:hypothetical protein